MYLEIYRGIWLFLRLSGQAEIHVLWMILEIDGWYGDTWLSLEMAYSLMVHDVGDESDSHVNSLAVLEMAYRHLEMRYLAVLETGIFTQISWILEY